MSKESGFTLVELMVVTAIMAILAVVAVPAYVNYRHRAAQSEAFEALLRAKMDQEVFWTENNRYASTIRALPSFGNSLGGANNFLTPSGYTIQVTFVNVNGTSFRVRATRTIYSGVNADTLSVGESDDTPRIGNPDALGFSLFRWLFS